MDNQLELETSVDILISALEESGPGPESDCLYLDDRQAREIGIYLNELPQGFYRILMDRGFRRSGPFFYRPTCCGCNECRPIRLLVRDFVISNSQKRCRKKNSDLQVRVQSPVEAEWKYEMYQRYVLARHAGTNAEEETYDLFTEFLYRSPIETLEILYIFDEQVVGIGIVDREPDCLSAVYCYFEPEFAARSLGLFNLLWCVDYCSKEAISHFYMGYFIEGTRKMRYKANLKPHEFLKDNRDWSPE